MIHHLGKTYTPLQVAEEIDWPGIHSCIVVYRDHEGTVLIKCSSCTAEDKSYYLNILTAHILKEIQHNLVKRR